MKEKHGNKLGLVAIDEVAIRWCKFHQSKAHVRIINKTGG